MNKLTYGTFDPNNAETPFLQTKGYVDPANGEQTRRQLGQPLREIKAFLDDTMPVDTSGNIAQIQASSNGIKYRTTSGGAWTSVGGGLDIATVIDTIYPVGAIYISTVNTSPSTLFPNTTWSQLKDRFLLGAGTTYTAGNTGGSATVTLTLNQIPSHTHNYTRYNTKLSGVTIGSSGDPWTGNTTVATESAGGGQAHNNMPPYLVVYMWKRTA